MPTMMTKVSPLALYATLIALVCLALAAVLFISPGPESNQRLGLFFGVLGPTIIAIVAVLRSDQAASNTNGSLDDRMLNANLRANNARRASDIVPDDASAADPSRGAGKRGDG